MNIRLIVCAALFHKGRWYNLHIEDSAMNVLHMKETFSAEIVKQR